MLFFHSIAILFVLFHKSLGEVRTSFKILNYTGSGCPEGTISSSINLDTTALAQSFDRFPLYLGPGTIIRDHYKNCTLYANISFSEPNWQLYVNPRSMDVRGYFPMDVGTSLRVQSKYDWAGSNKMATNTFTVQGPLRDTFIRYHVDNATDNVVVSPCGGGILRTRYDAAATTTTSHPGGFDPDDPEPGIEFWTFLTSLQLSRCPT
ncbi:hypothetical protein BCR34DRAFT_599438 [Clohesyomyces aquaticus]|uniref:Secreted protein n=1 Tax=Clohesyomyces aquaticus TaxID=1231657 RepID=A0A1Y1ZUX2_9PLEO|nr:hypothetical protein BCR34DRAFT_599438 [Clohesyomyces aquaticus]